MTRPGYAPEHMPTWALRPGWTVSDDARPAHEVAAAERCHDGVHLRFADGTETVCGLRHMWTVTR